MDFIQKIDEAIKSAMMARDKVRLETLRGIKKELLEAKTAKGSDGSVSEEKALDLIKKLLKQRKESAEIFRKNNREDLAMNELAEATILEEFLPKQLSHDELIAFVQKKVAETGISDPKMAGKLTGMLLPELKGQTGGKELGEAIREVLGS